MSAEKLNALQEAVSGAERLLILTHNDPDPDAIGSAVALRHLLVNQTNVEVKIAYRGIIGRAENKALVSYLDHPLKRLSRADVAPPVTIAFLDTQPGAGNSPLRRFTDVALIIDHHPWHPDSVKAHYADVRPDVGSTSILELPDVTYVDLTLPSIQISGTS